MEGRAPASPFAPSSPKRPSLWRLRAPSSTRCGLPNTVRAARAYRSGSLKGHQRWNARPWRAVDLATATVGRSPRWLERFYCSGPIPFPNRNSKPVQSPPNLFSSSSIVAFMVNARDEGVASTKEARAEEGPCVLPLERLHFNPTPVSRADDSARIKFVWTAIMLISPPRIDTDETRIAESQNFLTL